MLNEKKRCLYPSGTLLFSVDLQLDSAPYLGTFTLKKNRSPRDPGDLVRVLSSGPDGASRAGFHKWVGRKPFP